MKKARFTVALLFSVLAVATLGAGSAGAKLTVKSLTAEFLDLGTGLPMTQAGSHPDFKTNTIFDIYPGFPSTPSGLVKEVVTDMPAGFYGNPQAQPFCDMEQLQLGNGFCNPDAQVGVFTLDAGVLIGVPVYNMKSSTAQTAVLATVAFGIPVKFIVSVRTDGDYGLQVKIPNINTALGLKQLPLELWGVPAAASHDNERCKAVFQSECVPSTLPPAPFFTLPPRCGEPLTTGFTIRSYEEPGAAFHQDIVTPALTGCDNLDFSPSQRGRPTTSASDSPSGLDIVLHMPQNVDPEGVSSGLLRKAEVTLPEGFVLSPAGSQGLEACTPEQIHLTSAPGNPKASFSKAEPECPDASRIGTVQVDTPLLADPLLGSVYVAEPYDNPFNSLVALYATFKGPGLNIKLPGEVRLDPKTGQVTTIFDENPQIAFEDFKYSLFGGAFAALRSPAICGTFEAKGTMTAWSAPETPTVAANDKYTISQAPGGKKGCATTRTALPNNPAFEAGSTAALAGQYKPFVLNLRRDDGTQEFSEITLNPPPGLVAKLADTQICSDAALATAAGKTGKQERANASCPAASEVGSVFVAAGAGPAPYWTPGKVYLAGPYKGAPLSFAIITPAVGGPYDLGTVVTKNAVQIDPVTAQVTVKADPIPEILKGIPLDVRQILVRVNKPDFMLNPTSCDPMEVKGALLSTLGNTANLNNRFQLAECGRLKFKPKLALSLKGGTKRGEYPALTAVLKNRSGDANIKSVQVALPHSEFLAQNHIRTICTRVQWAADACPKASIYGTVAVKTPLLGYPVKGNVYLRASNNPLPDLVPDLRGPAYQPIRFEAAGKTDSIKGGLRNTFNLIPDVPFSKLTLKLKGGKKGLLQNSRNICASTNKANVAYTAHNGLAHSERPKLTVKCKKAKKGKSKKGKRGGKR
jgi:hypothetical protein